MENKQALFCDGCPMIPKGVRAELTDAEVLGPELRRYRAFVESAELRKSFEGKTRLHAKVVECNNGTADIDDVSAMVVDECVSFEQAAALVEACKGKVSVNLLQKLVGHKTRCGAFDNRYLT